MSGSLFLFSWKGSSTPPFAVVGLFRHAFVERRAPSFTAVVGQELRFERVRWMKIWAYYLGYYFRVPYFRNPPFGIEVSDCCLRAGTLNPKPLEDEDSPNLGSGFTDSAGL